MRVENSCILSCCVKLGPKFIDRQGKEVLEEPWVKCDGDDRRNSSVSPNNTLVITKSGFTFSFAFSPDSNTYRLQHIECRVKVLPRVMRKNAIPVHLFGELAKTAAGVALLANANVLKALAATLGSEEASLVQKKGALWAIGNIGSSKTGLNFLLTTDLVRRVVRLAEEAEVLSLRGVALCALGLLVRTGEGKEALQSHNWRTHSKPGVSVAAPRNVRTLFTLSPLEFKGDVTGNKEAWTLINDTIRRYDFSEEYLTVLKLIGDLSNHITQKNAFPELKRISQLNPKVFMDARLYHCVVLLLTNYCFKLQPRKYIIQLFDKLLYSANFIANYSQAISLGSPLPST